MDKSRQRSSQIHMNQAFLVKSKKNWWRDVIVNENPAKKGKKIHHFWIKKLLTFFKIFFLFPHSKTFTLN
jgi:hypothetical protein